MSTADVREAVDYGMATSKPIRSLMTAMAQLGCPVDRAAFHVLRCDAAVGGGFAPGHGVILCHNRLHTRREVLNAMTHELIHAYDHCRAGAGTASAAATAAAAEAGSPGAAAGSAGTAAATAAAGEAGGGASPTAERASAGTADGASRSRVEGGCGGGGGGEASWPFSSVGGAPGSAPGTGLDWSNCYHHACTEIRAANLSGDCSLTQELMRGNLPLLPTGWAAQQAACVARRAALSVGLNPACAAPGAAEEAVAAMMAPCLADTAPLGAGDGVARP